MAPALPATNMDSLQAEKDTKIQELRDRLSTAAGQLAAQQLVQGGELTTTSDLTETQFLHKWLRARSWDVTRAYHSIIKHAEWRVTNMPKGSVDLATIKNELACEKVYIQGCDHKGRPLAIIQVRKHNGWTRYLDELERLCCYILDECVRYAGAAAHRELNPRGQLVALLDLTDMGALSMDIQAIKTLFQLLGEHYVERLGAMYFWNPPTIFWGAWNTLSPLLPEPTRAKIRVLDPTQAAELAQLIGGSTLPREYGGSAELAPPLGQHL